VTQTRSRRGTFRLRYVFCVRLQQRSVRPPLRLRSFDVWHWNQSRDPASLVEAWSKQARPSRGNQSCQFVRRYFFYVKAALVEIRLSDMYPAKLVEAGKHETIEAVTRQPNLFIRAVFLFLCESSYGRDPLREMCILILRTYRG
jgi:hypothetical protein